MKRLRKVAEEENTVSAVVNSGTATTFHFDINGEAFEVLVANVDGVYYLFNTWMENSTFETIKGNYSQEEIARVLEEHLNLDYPEEMANEIFKTVK